MTTTTNVTCRCGACAIALDGEPLAQFYCHCDDCQAAHGAPLVPVAMFPTGAVTITRGTPLRWKLRDMPRVTCPECGTRLFGDRSDMGMVGFNGYLLPDGKFTPTFHIQCGFARVRISDGLPHFKRYPARFGGSDETVDW